MRKMQEEIYKGVRIRIYPGVPGEKRGDGQ